MRKNVLIGGIVAGMAMAMMEMIYEGLFGVGFWSAPIFIAATILRDLQGSAAPAFSLVPVLVGIMGHMMNSIILAFLFTTVLYSFFNSRVRAAVAGALYGMAIFVGMWFVVLPIIDPVMLNLNPWVFVMSHALWGAIIGLLAWKKETSAGKLEAARA